VRCAATARTTNRTAAISPQRAGVRYFIADGPVAETVLRRSRGPPGRRVGGEEADEPGVVVERPQRREDEPAPGEGAAHQRRDHRRHVPAAVLAVLQVEVGEAQLAAAHDPEV